MYTRPGIIAYGLEVFKSLPVVRYFVQQEIEKAYAQIWKTVTKDGIPDNDPPLIDLPVKVNFLRA